MAVDLTEFDRLVTLCECTYYSHLRAMSLCEEGKASDHFVSACEAAHRMARESLRDYIQLSAGVWAKQYDDGTWAACRGDDVITPPTYPTAEAALRAAGVSGLTPSRHLL
jgi:hypothetical protein